MNATGSDAYRFAIPSISMVVLTATPPDDTSRTPPSLTMVSLARPPELTASVPPSVTVVLKAMPPAEIDAKLLPIVVTLVLPPDTAR